MSKKYIFNNVTYYDITTPIDFIKSKCIFINMFSYQHINILDKIDIKTKSIIMKLLFDKLNNFVDDPTDVNKSAIYKYIYNGDFCSDLLNLLLSELVELDEQTYSQYEAVIENNMDDFFINIINDIFVNIKFTDLKDFLLRNILEEELLNDIKEVIQYDETMTTDDKLKTMIDEYAKNNKGINMELFTDLNQAIINIYLGQLNTNQVIINIIQHFLNPIADNIFKYHPTLDVIYLLFEYRTNVQNIINNPNGTEIIMSQGFSSIQEYIDSVYIRLIETLKEKINDIIINMFTNNNIRDLLNQYVHFNMNSNIYDFLTNTRRSYIPHGELSNLVHPNQLIINITNDDDYSRENIIKSINKIILEYLKIKINIYLVDENIINCDFKNADASENMHIGTGLYENQPIDNLFFIHDEETTDDIIERTNGRTFTNMKEFMENMTENDIVISFCEYYTNNQYIVKKYV